MFGSVVFNHLDQKRDQFFLLLAFWQNHYQKNFSGKFRISRAEMIKESYSILITDTKIVLIDKRSICKIKQG